MTNAEKKRSRYYLIMLNVFMVLFTVMTWFFAYNYAQTILEEQRVEALFVQQREIQISACEKSNEVRVDLNILIDDIKQASIGIQEVEGDPDKYERRAEFVAALEPVLLIDCYQFIEEIFPD